MRKIRVISLLLVIIFMSSCGHSYKYTGVNNGVLHGIKLNLEQKSKNSKIMQDFEINDDTAIEIGNLVLESIFSEEIYYRTSYSIQYIDSDDVYWFSRRSLNNNLDDFGSINVAIGKRNGEIKAIWISDD